ncbi:MFS transporter [Chania multitudinisentens RB-25]|uniref:MFS transporter n=1 Tax=Chania multitudinisentens RB-25 TaxID=1441930 RepID=W0L4E5_9GAMM|nr:MFS transporter [Chania multitudinisentens]AHG18576.1 MFS transporter [Chania multitudinisentens RB-25]
MEQAPAHPQKAVWRDQRAIALLMAASLTVMANATISPALAGLEAAFSGNPNAGMLTRLLVPAPSLSIVLCAPFAGIFADRFGRRGMLLVGVLLFIITGSAGLYLPSLPAIFASRLALGVAVALIMTSGTALIGDYFTGDQRNDLVGLQVSARNFGGFLFISLAGYMAAISPRLPFAIYGLAVFFLPLMWVAITEPDRPASRARMPGNHGHPAWKPLIFTLAILQMMTNMIFFVMPTQLPFFFNAQGYNSAMMTGSTLGVLTLAGGCAALLYARIKRTIGFLGNYTLGYAMMAFGFTLINSGVKPWVIFIGAAAIGAGYATVSPNFVAIALNLVPEQHRGLTGGILTTSIFTGQFLSPLLSIPLISIFGYDETFYGISLLLGAMALAAGITRRKY